MKFHKIVLDTHWDEFRRDFKKQNRLEYLDGGSYASAWTSTKERKVVYKLCELENDDIDGYLYFLKHIVSRNTHNPCIPRIYGVNIYEYHDWDEIHYKAIVKMEKLIHYTALDRDQRFRILTRKYGMDNHGIDITGEDRWLDEIHHSIARKQRSSYLDKMPKSNLTKVFYKVKKHVRNDTEKNIWQDIHDGNVMWRKTGRDYELVVTDPIS